jgi:hypothetical protein
MMSLQASLEQTAEDRRSRLRACLAAPRPSGGAVAERRLLQEIRFIDRRSCFAAALGTLSVLPPLPAAAKDYGKAYESCLSQCIYEETKIAKGIAKVEVVSKQEAMDTCKAKCASKKVKKN